MTKTNIEWTDRNWNPVRAFVVSPQGATVKWGYHCTHIHHGCDNCYAEAMNRRAFPTWGTGLAFKPGYLKQIPDADCDRLKYPRGSRIEIRLDEKTLTEPLRTKRAQKWFLSSMTDVFATFVTDDMLDRIFAVMALAPQHTFQVLTKRPDRAGEYLRALCGETEETDRVTIAAESICGDVDKAIEADNAMIGGLPNVWLGTSISTQADAEAMIPHLLAAPAAVRFVSAEPLLGPVDLEAINTGWNFLNALRGLEYHDDPDGVPHYRSIPPSANPRLGDRSPRLDWIIVGGESGRNARPMHPDWVRSIRDQTQAAGVALFFKQWGEYAPIDKVLPSERNDVTYWPDGTLGNGNCNEKGGGGQSLRRVGKAHAGRALDGREWSQFSRGEV